MKYHQEIWNNSFEEESVIKGNYMHTYNEVVNSQFEAVFANLKKEELSKMQNGQVAMSKQARIAAFLAAIGQFKNQKNLASLVSQKFGCKFEELTERRQATYSAVALLSQGISAEHASMQTGLPLGQVDKLHSLYKISGFTGVKNSLNKLRKAV